LWFDILDPKFISDSILKLKLGSPCIDQGNPNVEFNDADGTRNDQGAYGGPKGDWYIEFDDLDDTRNSQGSFDAPSR